MNPTLADPASILAALVRCPSVSPDQRGAQDFLAWLLGEAGLTVTRLTFSASGTPDVENLFASIGTGAPHLVFAGHTDVVPPGDEAGWSHPPFAGEVADGVLFGRGAVDMKGGIAAFAAAALAFLARRSPLPGTLSFLITGDEEGPAVNGTVKLVEWAKAAGHRFDAAIVGEPTCRARIGDTIKIGRRGSLSGTIRVFGRQGHVAYPHLAENPVTGLIRLLGRLSEIRLDEGNAAFPPSNLEVVSVDVGNPAFNVIPSVASARFNIRFNDQWTARSLEDWLRGELQAASGGYRFDLLIAPGASEWFLTRSEALVGTLDVRDPRGDRDRAGAFDRRRHVRCPLLQGPLPGDRVRPRRRYHAPDR